jgi:hypothetical protein
MCNYTVIQCVRSDRAVAVWHLATTCRNQQPRIPNAQNVYILEVRLLSGPVDDWAWAPLMCAWAPVIVTIVMVSLVATVTVTDTRCDRSAHCKHRIYISLPKPIADVCVVPNRSRLSEFHLACEHIPAVFTESGAFADYSPYTSRFQAVKHVCWSHSAVPCKVP